MRAGDLVGGRFEIDEPIGSGGMGAVFRARDRMTGGVVAIKVLRSEGAHDSARFEREATILSEISHPGIVGYVAHGRTPEGAPYLAMEWLDGEDLHARLRRGRLTARESAALTKRLAEVLAVAHARGIVHRDLKPSNIFLCGGSVDAVKILDFGIARLDSGAALTRSATAIGTPGYMAPEQARGEPAVGARADVFALGCVLFECLTGAPAFSGPSVMVVLAKVLFEEVPPVRDLCPEAPQALAALCTRMLAKEAADRPLHGAALAAALEAIIAEGALDAEPPATGPASALTRGEQRLVSVVLVSPPHAESCGGSTTRAQTATLLPRGDVRGVALTHNGRSEILADGAAVVILTGAHAATDLAARAARCALSLSDLSERRPVAVAMGRGDLSARAEIGDVLDRAGRLLAACDPVASSRIVVDEVIAGLLDAKFDVQPGRASLELRAERAAETGSRTLLGKRTPCVGRERELASLGALLDECIGQPVAQAVVITAPPGIGKSRLAREFLSALSANAESRPPFVAVWAARGDAFRAGSALGLLRQVLEAAIGVQAGEPQEAQLEKLRACVERHVPPADQRRVTEFLGEILGLSLPDDASPPLRAARLDARLMSDQMQGAWEDFCAAECSARPILLVLEDLHWGDLATVRFIDAALRCLRSRPFMVLALARPEVHDLFPNLWADRGAQQIRLKGLSQRASERLIREVLGDAISPAMAQRIAALADGNAFFLEELIRAAADGEQAALPETVVAMVQARLEGLEGDARRILRAASIFGETFWQSGFEALLPGLEISPWLASLVERELLVRRRESRLKGEQELSFRHALLREAAYAMLTPADRETGHRLAAEWLEAHGEDDPLVLAEHWERARAAARAGRHYARAAERALRGGDWDGEIAWARRGLDCDVPDDVRQTLLKHLCEGHAWRSEHSLALPYAEEIMQRSPPGSEAWAFAMNVKLGHATITGDLARFPELLGAMRGITPEPGAVGAVAFSLVAAMFWLELLDRHDLAGLCIENTRALTHPVIGRDPTARGYVNLGSALHCLLAEDPWAGLQAAEIARASFREIGNRSQQAAILGVTGANAWALGAFEAAERELREALSGADKPNPLTLLTIYWLVETLVTRGTLDDAYEQAERGLAMARASGFPPDEGRARWAMADVLLRRGELEAAEREATGALDRLTMIPMERAAATTTLAAIRLAQGRPEEALGALPSVVPRLRAALARVLRAEALRAMGDVEGSRAAITAARDSVLAVAATIEDPSYRSSYLENVPEVARTLELARRWLDGADDR